MTVALPRPCRPPDDPHAAPPTGPPAVSAADAGSPADPRGRRQWRQWYECVLGWPTWPAAEGRPLELITGVRFDALGMPAEAGFAALGRVPATGPVALDGRARRMWFLTAVGSADELPGLLAWLEWGGIALELSVLGPGGRLVAPEPSGARQALRGPYGPGGAVEAVWVRPPEPGGAVEPTLPVAGLGGDGGAPDLVRLVSAAATECHRNRLLRAARARRDQPPDRPAGPGDPDDQALAFSYASRISAGTRPRSFTL
ncbi:hypothetical protein J1792_07750 [Streptomyces triculaminicus]|uniref:Proline-rich protein n=2 Tax=Streptomyces TaxID=1883 RepID=A0A939JPY4_9ACTN|nr:MULTISPECIES: SCO3374 family protein [Streptomyces]MBO0652680.1 hypothetical protein [Streptomyces triculaminicus]QSY51748.1 hypothetical protein J3S04_13305 [Streptomyces griseocarneus]